MKEEPLPFLEELLSHREVGTNADGCPLIDGEGLAKEIRKKYKKEKKRKEEWRKFKKKTDKFHRENSHGQKNNTEES